MNLYKFTYKTISGTKMRQSIAAPSLQSAVTRFFKDYLPDATDEGFTVKLAEVNVKIG